MDINTLIKIYNKFKYGESLYNKLMQKRIRKILIVSTFYNAFVLEEESKFSEQIIGGYHQYNLTTIPKIKNALNSSHALKILEKEKFDLIISTLRIGEPNPFELSKIVKKYNQETAFILLFTESFDLKILTNERMKNIDNVFLWGGEPSLFLAMIKSVEDRWNAPNDTSVGGVSVILLIEDSIDFYSLYLPEIYRLLMKQTQKLIKEEANNDIKYLRMRTRPKILLAKTFEQAKNLYTEYKDYLLAVITDMELDNFESAGLEIIDFVKNENPYVPVLAQSSNASLLKKAREKGVEVSHKNTPFVLNDFNTFLMKNCGFGDFVFRDGKGNEIAVAKTFNEFEKLLSEIPIESFEYHSKKKDFCTWLIPRRELTLARKLRKINKNKFETLEKHRQFLLNVIKYIKTKNRKGKILNLTDEKIDNNEVIYKIGEGSLGGKGRGLSFLNALFAASNIKKKFKSSIVQIPKTCIVSTDFFDEFIMENYLYLDYEFHADEEIIQFFINAKLPDKLKVTLKKILRQLDKPLMVRSSGLLEDSQFHPFAGIYKSVTLPNCSSSLETRMKQLEDAIKLVYASVYLRETRAYINRLGLKIEEEKMAVIIQEVVGNKFENFFYPHFAGVAQSFNYYPLSYMKKKDGIVTMALGFGKYVVEGEKCFRFCPEHSKIRFLSDEEMLKTSQTEFYALNLEKCDAICNGEDSFLVKLPIKKAEKHGTISLIASTYDIINRRIEPGIYTKGPRVINFDNILLYDYFPLANMLNEILKLSEYAVGSPVEIEFAATIDNKLNLSVLQVRPLTTYENLDSVKIGNMQRDKMIVYTEKGCGHGIINNVKNIVFIEPELFDKTRTVDMKKEVNAINELLKEKGEEYVLIGPGRWGSRDKFLGIPVNWEDINMVKTIVETGIKDFDIEPSQGTHFIHNIISMNIGYFNVPFYAKENNFINWTWLKSLKPFVKKSFVTLISLDQPLTIIMDGRNGQYAVIAK